MVLSNYVVITQITLVITYLLFLIMVLITRRYVRKYSVVDALRFIAILRVLKLGLIPTYEAINLKSLVKKLKKLISRKDVQAVLIFSLIFLTAITLRNYLINISLTTLLIIVMLLKVRVGDISVRKIVKSIHLNIFEVNIEVSGSGLFNVEVHDIIPKDAVLIKGSPHMELTVGKGEQHASGSYVIAFPRIKNLRLPTTLFLHIKNLLHYFLRY